MDFYEVVDQVVDLLRRRGRVTYRALKRQFQLDDDFLEDLKDELIKAQHLAVDENDEVLVWTGAPAATSALDSPPPQTPQQPTHEPPRESRSPEAERRQLTILFTDLVDSTMLSGQLDAEDYRELVRAYQAVCADVIERFDCHLAQTLGDGLLIYSGYPIAHENDAERAVRVGLGIIQAMKALNERLEQDKGVRLSVRVGIHTGLVVVGDVGAGVRHEHLALGETPNVAARIQGLAAPDTMIISDATYRLVQGFFDCESLGEYDLRGVSQPIVVYRVLQANEAQSRLDVASSRGLTPLVGRESEVTLLLDRWHQSKGGIGQVVLLKGEPGLGKSRLVQTLKEQIINESHTRLECRSSPYYQNTALYPIIDLLQRLLRWEQGESADERLGKLEWAFSQYHLSCEETVPLMAGLLSLPLAEDKYAPLNLTPQRQRQKTLETIVAFLLELADRQPMLFIVEDLHWTDPTTLELLELFIHQMPTASIYTLLTCRPEFQAPWGNRSSFTQVTLNRLLGDEVEQMVTRVTGGKSLPGEIIRQLVDKTDGVPLYVEEMTKAVLESGVLKELDGQYEFAGSLSSLSIPSTLQDSLMARLDRLGTGKAVAQCAAVIGRQFSYALLSAMSPWDEATLQHELGRLVEAELVSQQGALPHATYLFKHALVQDIAYESLLRRTRQQYHAHIATVLETRFPQTCEAQPELLAHHYTEAGLNEQAIRYWQQAGEYAVQRSANIEAVGHLTKGLEILKALPDTPERTQHELTMCITLGGALLATKGYAAPEVEHVYTRALELCQRIGNPPQLSSALFGLWRYYIVRAAYQNAHALAEHLLGLAQSSHDTSIFVLAHYTLGWTCFNLGEIARARAHLEESTALYTPRQRHTAAFRSGQDPGVACLSFATLALWSLGYPDRARSRSHEAVRLAQELAHPFSIAFALIWAAAIPQQLCREALQAHEQAQTAVAFATEQGFALLAAWGTILRGWALAVQGQSEEGIAQMTQGLAAHRTMGSEALLPYFLALLAEAHGKVGRIEQGLHLVAEALAVADDHEERFHEAELHRLKGELLLQQSADNQPEAESCFQQAISIAQRQQAKSWELRAATSLARLWQSQNKRQDAADLLAPVYNWFTEGFDTADLQDAKALLDELSESQ
jgi:class 3 adenylate cyclase/predicted ATPase